MTTVLVTGAAGQIGSELTPALRERDSYSAVIASDVETDTDLGEPYEVLDVTDRSQVAAVVDEYDVDVVFHLAAILSAVGEQNPQAAFDVNVTGLYNVLEVARQHDLEKVVVPSSIAVFGPDTPDRPAEKTVLSPTTMYGVSKTLTEHLGRYYARKYDLDVRGVRFPGLLSWKTRPGGGTTDYAVDAFYDAIEKGSYTYFVREDTQLPMMYMPDAINALLQLAAADRSDLRYQCEYNVSALCFTPRELTAAIQDRLPSFEATYSPDQRQQIADSWPSTVDDSAAREDWDWSPAYDLDDVVDDMFANLRSKLEGATAQQGG